MTLANLFHTTHMMRKLSLGHSSWCETSYYGEKWLLGQILGVQLARAHF